MDRYYLAVDIGASSDRHILGRTENGKMKLREIYRSSNGMKMVDDTLCWNLNGLSGRTKAGMRECKRLGINPESIGINTQAVDSVPLDKQGYVLDKTADYRDRYTERVDLKIYKRISREELLRRTSIQKQIFNMVYRPMAVKKKKSDIFSEAESLLMVPDYLNFLLTRVRKQEYVNATTTQLVNPSEHIWNKELIEALGYPQKLFGGPSIPGTVMGRLSEDVREETGLDCRMVSPTTHDTGCAVAAVSSNRGHVFYISSDTWSPMGTELKDANCREVSIKANFTNEGGYEHRYRFLRNIMGLWMIQSVKREWKKSGKDYSSDEICERAPRKTTSSTVDCNDSRFLAPESMCDVVKTYCEGSGQQVPEIKWGMAAVTYNNLADYYCICCREIRALAGVYYDCIHIAGGGTNADYLNRLTAKATGKAAYAGLTEATAIDNLTVQMIEGKEFESLEKARDSVFRSFEIRTYEPSGRVC